MAQSHVEDKKWPWRFGAFEVGDSVALGGSVRLDVEDRVTVLVGRNGAGKSALLEKLTAGAWGATGVVDDVPPDPGRFACELPHHSVPDVRARYECRWTTPPVSGAFDGIATEEPKDEARFAEIAETCTLGDEVLWQLRDGLLRRNDGTTATLPPGRGLLNWFFAHRGPFTFSAMVEPLHDLLWRASIRYVRAGVPRAFGEREVAVLPYPWPYAGAAKLRRRYEHVPFGIRSLTLQLAEWHERHPDVLEEFVAIGQRLRVFDKIQVQRMANPEQGSDARLPAWLAAVSVDGTNLGLLSDGTLRVMAILSALIDPALSLLLIEEPEIAVHPGLLSRLLAEIETYSLDRQVILSTQSPQTVSWARADSLRLVERVAGQTRVRGLLPEERSRIEQYLHDEGTLGDFVYSGAMDG